MRFGIPTILISVSLMALLLALLFVRGREHISIVTHSPQVWVTDDSLNLCHTSTEEPNPPHSLNKTFKKQHLGWCLI